MCNFCSLENFFVLQNNVKQLDKRIQEDLKILYPQKKIRRYFIHKSFRKMGIQMGSGNRHYLVLIQRKTYKIIPYQSTWRGKNVGERHWKMGFIRSAVHNTICPIGCKQQLIKKLSMHRAFNRTLQLWNCLC